MLETENNEIKQLQEGIKMNQDQQTNFSQIEKGFYINPAQFWLYELIQSSEPDLFHNKRKGLVNRVYRLCVTGKQLTVN